MFTVSPSVWRCSHTPCRLAARTDARPSLRSPTLRPRNNNVNGSVDTSLIFLENLKRESH